MATTQVARVLFVWVSVFNLFAVSVFWSFMADLFRSDQGKRLFGFIAAGGSAGALAGPALTVWLAEAIGPVNLLLVAGSLLEVAVLCVRRLEPASGEAQRSSPRKHAGPTPLGGGGWA